MKGPIDTHTTRKHKSNRTSEGFGKITVPKSRIFMTGKSLAMVPLIFAFCSALTFVFVGCDLDQFALLSTIPNNAQQTNTTHIFVGCDGVPDNLAKKVIEKRYPSWQRATLITAVPGISTYAWPRMFRMDAGKGYELRYFDPIKREIIYPNITSLLSGAVPRFKRLESESSEYTKVFDKAIDGVLDQVREYGTTELAMGETLDAMMYYLENRLPYSNVVTIYIATTDVLGHSRGQESAMEALDAIISRLETFRKQHNERQIDVTLFSDHGMDNIPANGSELISAEDLLNMSNVENVKSLPKIPDENRYYALPVETYRVSVLGLHTLPQQADEIGKRISAQDPVELSITVDRTSNSVAEFKKFRIWKNGKLAWEIAYDPRSDMYGIPVTGPFDSFNIIEPSPSYEKDGRYWISDEYGFAITKDSPYPDLFFHMRTSISRVSVIEPYDVLLSFKRPYASKGFGPLGIATAGFHGGLYKESVNGMLVTTSRSLPDAVRSDSILDLFPELEDYLRNNNNIRIKTRNDENNLALNYDTVDNILSELKISHAIR